MSRGRLLQLDRRRIRRALAQLIADRQVIQHALVGALVMHEVVALLRLDALYTAVDHGADTSGGGIGAVDGLLSRYGHAGQLVHGDLLQTGMQTPLRIEGDEAGGCVHAQHVRPSFNTHSRQMCTQNVYDGQTHKCASIRKPRSTW